MSSAHRRILITGAAGAIGSTLRERLRDSYDLLRLTDLRALGTPAHGEEHAFADLTDFPAVQQTMQGIDCVVHLGGAARESPWDVILEHNIAGTYNVFEAARACGVKRIVFASSNHAVGFYRTKRELGVEEPPRPDSRYGVSKVFGEALGRLYADKHGLSVACLRIGSFRERPGNSRELATWISPRDMVQLVRRCIDAPSFHYLVLYGVSANRRARWTNPHAASIGYRPQDNAEAYARQLTATATDGSDAGAQFHGGPLCDLEFDGNWRRIE